MRPSDIHVWTAAIGSAWTRDGETDSALSRDERRRAERIHHGPTRVQFVAGRSFLRAVLARYLGTEPSRLIFQYGRHGKPALGGVFAKESLAFNVSHSDDVVAVAVALGRDVGVDIERVRPVWPGVAASVLSDGEQKKARKLLDSRDGLRWFFGVLTKKEALVKARGEGLTAALPMIQLAPPSGSDSGGCSSRLEDVDAVWRCSEIAIDPPFVGAVAARGEEWKVSRFNWDWNQSRVARTSATRRSFMGQR